MKRDMNQWLSDLKSAPVKQAMPILSFPAVQLMDITVKDLISSSDNQAKGMKLIADRTDAAAAVSLMDLSVEAECFGSRIIFSEDEVPTVKGNVISDMDEVEALEIPAIGAGRTSIYIDAIKKAAELIEDRPVFAGIIGPYSLAGRLLDVTEIMYLSYDEPEMVAALLDKAMGGTGAVCRDAACWFYIANEGISILENVGQAGAPYPEKLRRLLGQKLEETQKEAVKNDGEKT